MPNDVYRYTHAALSALVSPRVAHTILEDALRTKNQSSDTITVGAMRHLLAGAVRKELARTLPREGLKSTLKRLADELAAHPSLGSGQPTPVADALIAEADAERAILTLTAERAAADPPSAPAAPPSPAAPAIKGFGGTVANVSDLPPGRLLGRTPEGVRPVTRRRAASAAPPPKVVTRLAEPAQDTAVRLFGEIESVRQVVVVRRLEVVLERGEGVTASALPGLIVSSRHLLARSGELRALSVERAGGVLFLFPFGEDTVVVVTSPNVNIGAVLNARAALEEAA